MLALETSPCKLLVERLKEPRRFSSLENILAHKEPATRGDIKELLTEVNSILPFPVCTGCDVLDQLLHPAESR